MAMKFGRNSTLNKKETKMSLTAKQNDFTYTVTNENGDRVYTVQRSKREPYKWELTDVETGKVVDADRYRNDLFERNEIELERLGH